MEEYISIKQEKINSWIRAKSLKWYEVNSFGSYASQTIAGANLSSYHGLFVTSVNNSENKYVILSKLDDEVIIDGKNYYLSSNRYRNTVYPRGYKLLYEYKEDICPVFVYKINDTFIEKRIFILSAENRLLIKYKLLNGNDGVVIYLKPLLACRNYALIAKTREYNSDFYFQNNNVCLKPFIDFPKLFFCANAVLVDKTDEWYYDFYYKDDRWRGFKFLEDLYNPFVYTAVLNRNDDVFFSLSLDVCDIDLKEIYDEEKEIRLKRKRQNDIYSLNIFDRAYNFLNFKSLPLIKKDENGFYSIITAYPDRIKKCKETMLSLCGLSMMRGEFDVVRNILKRYVLYSANGFLPDYFNPLDGLPVYGNWTNIFWFVKAVYQYLQYSSNVYFVVDEIYAFLKDSIAIVTENKVPEVIFSEDGLLCLLKEQCDFVESGKTFFLNALWYQFMRIMAELAKELNEADDLLYYSRFSAKIKKALEIFFDGDNVYSAINGKYKADNIYPEYIYILNFDFPILPENIAKKYFMRLEREFLTSYGLRLNKQATDNNFTELFDERMLLSSYRDNKGKVCPWLLGEFIDIYMRFNKSKTNNKDMVCGLMRKIAVNILSEDMLGTIAEFFDSEFPHKAKGAFIYAPNIAEYVRIYNNYLLYEKNRLNLKL